MAIRRRSERQPRYNGVQAVVQALRYNGTSYAGSPGGYSRVWNQSGGANGTTPGSGSLSPVAGIPGGAAGGGDSGTGASLMNGANATAYGAGGGGGGGLGGITQLEVMVVMADLAIPASYGIMYRR